jgi:Flp pilus assembly pilin Flp
MLFQPGENGQGMLEYSLLLVMIAVVVIFILAVFGGTAVTFLYSNILLNL